MYKKLLRRLLLTFAGLTAILVVLVILTPQGQAAFRAALFIPQILPGVPIKPQEWFTADPTREAIRYPLANGEGEADLYLPGSGGRHSAVMFFQGVVPGGRYDPRIVALGEGLARSGMVVMIPWSQTQIEQRIDPDDVDVLVRAFQYLQTLDSVDPDRVGMGGICVGASLATVAAQDERVRHQVRFVNSFAGYYDAADLAKAIGSRSRFGEDYVAPWNPDSLTKRVFGHHLIEGVTQTTDRELLTRLFEENEPESADDFSNLATDAQAVYRLLKGVTPEEVDAVMAGLSPKTIAFFRAISPSTGIEKLEARMLIMHDRADRLVPSEESRRLADALGDDAGTYFTEFSLFQSQIRVHVGEGSSIGPLEYVREAFKLYMHMYNILRDVG
jgi:dienelactone hydrolase